MLKLAQSSAALVLPCTICIDAPLWPMVAWPATTRPPVGSVVGEMDCAKTGALSASATAAARTFLFGMSPPQSSEQRAHLHPEAAGPVGFCCGYFIPQFVSVPAPREEIGRQHPLDANPEA